MPPSPLLPRLSAAARYATHAMLEIAEAGGQVVASATIVRHQQLPGYYLDQLLGKLRRAQLLRSVRGPRGGYLLARPAASISLADIVCAIDGSLDPALIGAANDLLPVAAPECACAVEEAWRSAEAAMHEVMQRTSLAALLRRKADLEGHAAADGAGHASAARRG